MVVTRIYTPGGSLYEESLLSSNERSVLSSIVLAKSSLHGSYRFIYRRILCIDLDGR